MIPVLSDHLPALQVVIPLICAPVCVILRPGRAARAAAALGAFACLAIAALLLAETSMQGARSYALGGWAAPWGIEYRVDLLSAFVLVIVTAVAAVVFPLTRASVEREVKAERRHLFYALLMLCLAGMTGIAITGDLFNLFVFLEIASLSSYALVAFGAEARAKLAAFRYLVAGTVGATFVLIGIGLLYATTGTLNMADIASRLPEVGERAAVKSAFAFLVIGLAIKMALFPLHAWLPGAYACAPSVVGAFLAGSSTKVAVYALVRVVFGVFGADYAFARLSVDWVLLPCAALGVVVGGVVALYQDDVRRMFAWSSVAQVAYMALGAALASAAGLSAALVHMMNHALMKSAIFLALGGIVLRTGALSVDALAGIGRRMPLTLAGLVVACLGLVGVPGSAGFISKWYLLRAALERDAWILVVVIVVGSLLTVLYAGRIVEAAWLRKPSPGALPEHRIEAPVGVLAALWLLAGASLWLGIDTSLSAGVAERAALELLEVSAARWR